MFLRANSFISALILYLIYCNAWGLYTYTDSFKYPHEKKSEAYKSGVRRSHFKSEFLEIILPPKIVFPDGKSSSSVLLKQNM